MPALITVRAHAFSNPAALEAIISEHGLEDARVVKSPLGLVTRQRHCAGSTGWLALLD
ncbi:MAG: hypothetical protein KDJ22_00995 [Candidatus Competibacteraceae bacterium]|nr:hypothetical protein [Candidatus Competibacteraceae bacterium]MCP5127759.1 hypothetical protein [Gammaproteobacteria bacterium]HRX70138.1 hypothetical protein [Candidatus Competibacteraceae bacterium]